MSVIVLPWPDKRLSPNARVHWRERARIAKAAKFDGWAMTMKLPIDARLAFKQSEDPIPLLIRFCPPDKRHRDKDNMIAALKHQLDGIAEALGVNDKRFLPSFEFCEPEKPGRVEVVL